MQGRRSLRELHFPRLHRQQTHTQNTETLLVTEQWPNTSYQKINPPAKIISVAKQIVPGYGQKPGRTRGITLASHVKSSQNYGKEISQTENPAIHCQKSMWPQLHDVIPYHESLLQTTISSRENLSHCKPTLTTLSHPKKIQTDQHISTRSNHSVWPSPKNSLTDMRVKHLFLPTPRKLNEKQEATTHCCEVMKRNTRDANLQCNTKLPFQWHTQVVSHAQNLTQKQDHTTAQCM